MGEHYFIREERGLYVAAVMGRLRATHEEAERIARIFEHVSFTDARPQNNLCFDAIATNPPVCAMGMWLPDHKRRDGYQDNINVITTSRKQAVETLENLEHTLGCTPEPATKPIIDVAERLLYKQVGGMTAHSALFPTASFDKLFALQCYIGFRHTYEQADMETILNDALHKLDL